jgi:hypothetical protein
MTDQTKQPYPSPKPPVGAQAQPEYRAKQGRTGGRVFIVLAVSIVLAAIALFALWGMHAGQLSKAGAHGSQATSAADARKFNTPPPSPRVTGN